MHLITHMDGLPYHCTIYGKNFSKSNHLVIHMNNHSWNKCDACTSGNFEFTCLTQLRMHLITHIDGKLYHCTICGKSFSKSKASFKTICHTLIKSYLKYCICQNRIYLFKGVSFKTICHSSHKYHQKYCHEQLLN